jgi:heat-inducible transcriptional repressor
VLVVLVLDDREVQNRIVQLERHYSAEELRRAANFSTSTASGVRRPQIHQELVRQLKETHENLNQVMLDAISMSQRLFEQSARRDIEYVIAGETNLMGFSGGADVDKLKRLFEAFNEKRDILHLLDQSLRAEGVQIFIGQESGYQILDDYSVVTAPYSSGQGRGRRARGHRPDAHGLRARHSDRRSDRKSSRRGLEFASLSAILD